MNGKCKTAASVSADDDLSRSAPVLGGSNGQTTRAFDSVPAQQTDVPLWSGMPPRARIPAVAAPLLVAEPKPPLAAPESGTATATAGAASGSNVTGSSSSSSRHHRHTRLRVNTDYACPSKRRGELKIVQFKFGQGLSIATGWFVIRQVGVLPEILVGGESG